MKKAFNDLKTTAYFSPAIYKESMLSLLSTYERESVALVRQWKPYLECQLYYYFVVLGSIGRHIDWIGSVTTNLEHSITH